MTNQYRSYSDHYEQPFNQYNFHVQRFYKQFLNQITTTKYMTNQPYPTAELCTTNYLYWEDGYGALLSMLSSKIN